MESPLALDDARTDGNPRRQAILDAGKQVFLQEGFAGASMDRIADQAGVTKRTVYAHFASKHVLFAAAVSRACANFIARIPYPEALSDDPRTGLPQALHRSRELMESPDCIRLERVIAAEAERHPEFAETLRAAFAAGEDRLRQGLDAWVAAGRLDPHDTALAARMLNDLVGCAVSFRGLLGEPSGALQTTAVVDQAVALYLAAYGA